MIKTEKGYRFECSGREMDTFSFDGFSIFKGVVSVGSECRPEFFNDTTKLFSTEFTLEEKAELAKHMIDQWVEFAKSS